MKDEIKTPIAIPTKPYIFNKKKDKLLENIDGAKPVTVSSWFGVTEGLIVGKNLVGVTIRIGDDMWASVPTRPNPFTGDHPGSAPPGHTGLDEPDTRYVPVLRLAPRKFIPYFAIKSISN